MGVTCLCEIADYNCTDTEMVCKNWDRNN